MTEHREVASYSYVDEQGELLYEVVRLDPKSFRQRRILADGSMAWGLTSETRRVLYNLPRVMAASEVALLCGEKDCATAESLGLTPTTNSGGEAVKWIDEQGNRPDWIEPLRSKKIIFFPDCDEAGRKHAEDIIEALDGIAASLAIVWVPRGKDLTDFMTVEGGTNEELNKLIEVASLPSNSPVRKLRELMRRKGNPAAIQSEKLVLGAVMEGKVPFTEIDLLDQMDFHVHAHRKIYSALKDLNQKSGATDLKSVIQELEEREQLDEIGGMTYLVELTDDLPAVFDVDSHLETIKRKTAGRELLDDLTKASNNLIVGADPDEVKTLLVKSIDRASGYSSRALPTASSSEIIGDVDKFVEPRTMGIMCDALPTLFLDMFGFHPGQLVTIGGRSSTGKSSLGSQICAYAAGKYGIETEIISLEIAKKEAMLKLCCQVSKVSYIDVISGRITAERLARLKTCLEVFKSKPIRIDDSNSWSVKKIRNHIKLRSNSARPVRLLMLDYVQLMSSSSSEKRRDLELADITRGLKGIAIDFNLTVMMLSQLNREVEKRGGEPKLSDLRDADAIGCDSDIVILTHQDINDGSKNPERDATLVLGKQRNGPTGPYHVNFARPYAFFYEPGAIKIPPYC